MNIEEEFFTQLSLRLYKENYLSDITWALCNSSNWFMNLFLIYCFEEEISDIDSFEREYSQDDSRPDFYIITNKGKEYLLEVKIGDRNDHFKQYNKTFPNAIKSFIANYNVSVEKGWKIKNWKDFLKVINDKIAECPKHEKNIVLGYSAYLNSVICNVEVKQMNFTNIESLTDFYNCLSEIGQNTSLVSLSEYKSSSAIKSDRYGKYFYYINQKQEAVYFWIGLYIADYSAIYFLIDHYTKNEWCPKYEAEIIKKLKSGTYCIKTVIDGDGLWVQLKDEYYKIFCNNTTVQEQKKILQEFLDEILKKLLNIK
jgi:hypothetical protein